MQGLKSKRNDSVKKIYLSRTLGFGVSVLISARDKKAEAWEEDALRLSLLPGCGSAFSLGSEMFTCRKNRLRFLHLCTKSWYKQLVPGLLLSCSSFDQFQIGFVPAIPQRAAVFPVRGMNSSKSDLCLHFVHLHVLLKSI